MRCRHRFTFKLVIGAMLRVKLALLFGCRSEFKKRCNWRTMSRLRVQCVPFSFRLELGLIFLILLSRSNQNERTTRDKSRSRTVERTADLDLFLGYAFCRESR